MSILLCLLQLSSNWICSPVFLFPGNTSSQLRVRIRCQTDSEGRSGSALHTYMPWLHVRDGDTLEKLVLLSETSFLEKEMIWRELSGQLCVQVSLYRKPSLWAKPQRCAHHRLRSASSLAATPTTDQVPPTHPFFQPFWDHQGFLKEIPKKDYFEDLTHSVNLITVITVQ